MVFIVIKINYSFYYSDARISWVKKLFKTKSFKSSSGKDQKWVKFLSGKRWFSDYYFSSPCTLLKMKRQVLRQNWLWRALMNSHWSQSVEARLILNLATAGT